jgi:hypothetical protein
MLGTTLISVLIYYNCKIMLVNNCFEDIMEQIDVGLTVSFIEKNSELIMRFYILRGHVYEKQRKFWESLKSYTKALRYSWMIKD